MLLDPVQATVPANRELSILIHESEVHVVADQPTLQFVSVGYKIDSTESERIAVDHVAPNGQSPAVGTFAKEKCRQPLPSNPIIESSITGAAQLVAAQHKAHCAMPDSRQIRTVAAQARAIFSAISRAIFTRDLHA